MRFLLAPLALSLLALTACSGTVAEPDKSPEAAEVDQATRAWQADLDEATGGTVDFATHRAETAASCQRTEREDWLVDFALGGLPTAGADVVLLGLENGCPDVAKVYNATIEEVRSAKDPKQLVCTDPTRFGTEDQLKLQMAC